MKPQLIKREQTALVISEVNLNTGVLSRHKDLLTNVRFWHKFTVLHGQNYSRDEVLIAILNQVYPFDLIPVGFWKDNTGCHFFGRNCWPAIQKLCKDNLIVPNPKHSNVFKLQITLKYTTVEKFKIDVQKNILAILSKRYEPHTRTLNLDRFHEDPDLVEFCPLSQQKIMYFVLFLSKTLSPVPEKYILSNNQIKSITSLAAVKALYLHSLDLSNNLLESFLTLEPLKQFNDLKTLNLDGNLFCANIGTFEYKLEVKKYVPNLLTLDGISLKSNNLPSSIQNFFCNVEGYHLVNQFLEHYFCLYDAPNRKLLSDLYHTKAMFSLNSSYFNNQLTSATTRLMPYNGIARNLHKIADFTLRSKNLFIGISQITNILCSLPPTEHDPYSFLVDLIYYTPRCAIIGVTGTFRERPQTLLETEKIYGFRRIFTIERVNGDGLCYITNEQYHVHNGFSFQLLESFRVSKPAINAIIPKSDTENEKLIDALKIITTLNTSWSKKCLEECNYDLKKALALFVDLYKQNRIPEEGFDVIKKIL